MEKLPPSCICSALRERLCVFLAAARLLKHSQSFTSASHKLFLRSIMYFQMCCIEDYTCDVMINSLDFHKRKPAAFFLLEVFRVMNTNSSLNRSAFPQTDTSKILNCSHVNLTGSPCESHYSKSAARSANRHPVMVSCKCMSGSDH